MSQTALSGLNRHRAELASNQERHKATVRQPTTGGDSLDVTIRLADLVVGVSANRCGTGRLAKLMEIANGARSIGPIQRYSRS